MSIWNNSMQKFFAARIIKEWERKQDNNYMAHNWIFAGVIFSGLAFLFAGIMAGAELATPNKIGTIIALSAESVGVVAVALFFAYYAYLNFLYYSMLEIVRIKGGELSDYVTTHSDKITAKLWNYILENRPLDRDLPYYIKSMRGGFWFGVIIMVILVGLTLYTGLRTGATGAVVTLLIGAVLGFWLWLTVVYIKALQEQLNKETKTWQPIP